MGVFEVPAPTAFRKPQDEWIGFAADKGFEGGFNGAVVLEDSLDYDEPEPLPFAARHWLGALLLEQARYAEAEQVYRDELDDRPNNGWSLFGLHEALTAQGRPDPEIEAAFETSWARSDTWIRGSRF
ncbi:MAG: hypothetical protein AAF648_09085 [Pseudomonadota bacterium]